MVLQISKVTTKNHCEKQTPERTKHSGATRQLSYDNRTAQQVPLTPIKNTPTDNHRNVRTTPPPWIYEACGPRYLHNNKSHGIPRGGSTGRNAVGRVPRQLQGLDNNRFQRVPKYDTPKILTTLTSKRSLSREPPRNPPGLITLQRDQGRKTDKMVGKRYTGFY